MRSGRLQQHSDQYSGAPLYTVVTMDPNDEVNLDTCVMLAACAPFSGKDGS